MSGKPDGNRDNGSRAGLSIYWSGYDREVWVQSIGLDSIEWSAYDRETWVRSRGLGAI